MSFDAGLTDFVESLREQVAREAAHARQHIIRIWGAPLRSRLAVGHAIGGAKVHSVSGKWVHLDVGDHEALFREGDFLFWTEAGEPNKQPRVELVLESEQGSRFVCRIRSGRSYLSPGAEGVLDYGYFDLSDFLNQALDQALSTSRGRDKILPLLNKHSQKPTKCDIVLDGEAREFASLKGLNEAQTDALALAWSTDLAALVQGPPGTGKTAVLSRLAELAASQGKRVLVTGLTHRGIDNAMNAIHRNAPQLNIARIGAPTSGGTIPNWESFDDCPWMDTSEGFVLGATPFCLQSGRLKGVDFDYTLFDEASQVHLPLAILGMLGAERWVFFGDHKQLPPVLPTVPSEERTRSSIFGYLEDRDFGVLLDTTYRLCDRLCEWPSREMYNGLLRSHPVVANKRLDVRGAPGPMGAILNPEEPFVHVEVHEPGATTVSHTEAEVVVHILAAALQAGVPATELAVVTPFRRQNRVIRTLLRNRLGGKAESIAVDTVERMQGQEREMVVVSFTSGSDSFVERIAEFYFQRERLNVAVTRARCKLVLVGRLDWSDLYERRPDLIEQGEAIQSLLKCATKVDVSGENRFWRN